jgi:hypothetical protein
MSIAKTKRSACNFYVSFDVIPAKAGIKKPSNLKALDSGIRRNEDLFRSRLDFATLASLQ